VPLSDTHFACGALSGTPHDHRAAGRTGHVVYNLDGWGPRHHPSCAPMPSTRWIVQDLKGLVEPSTEELCKTICAKFQFGEVHRWQALAMQAVLRGQDVVVASGTGSGKSLVFQGLALSKHDAIVLVISPLISIMEEQVTTSDLRSC
jgi:hypothetical protein